MKRLSPSNVKAAITACHLGTGTHSIISVGKSQTLYRYHQNEKRNKSQKTNNSGTFMLTVFYEVWWLGEIFAKKKLALGRTENLGHLLEHSVGYILLIGPDPPVHPHPKLRQSYPGNNPVVNQSLVLKLDCMTPRGLCWPSWIAFSMKN